MVTTPHAPEDLVFSLIEQVGQLEDAAALRPFLSRVASVYGLANIAYFGMNIPGLSGVAAPYLAVTYSDAWVEHYKARQFQGIDPVLDHGFSSILPFDWRQLARDRRDVRAMFGESLEFGVGRQGLSFPVRGRLGDVALFTITGTHPDRDWDALLRQFTRDFQILALHIHDKVVRAQGNSQLPVSLTRRERQCLQWVALGKTVWETATILALSERTVRFYLDLARHKLGATNITHAVAQAITLGHIRSPATWVA
jgi:DNA-binding CsgD family transcriptional regulator